MEIGEYVKNHIDRIFLKLDNVENGELSSLLDLQSSKDIFKTAFRFCIEEKDINDENKTRYWKKNYSVGDKTVRVTSQWFERHRDPFKNYLISRGITPDIDLITTQKTNRRSNSSNSRYKGNPIGNSQNAFIRTILSNLGLESFSAEDWESSIIHFSRKCAYCGIEKPLQMDHAISINKTNLGEHRLGNLVPSCKECNQKKHHKNFREFLGENTEAITRIEKYMAEKNYEPLVGKELNSILDEAHKEVAALATTYITKINKLISNKSISEVI